ncbi:T9SS type A sorting domain-containing protein [Ulvibacter antarcticus]|nr:T9SS type A sorting domain-containing protein [Ulvibacter antarcticus]
MAFTFAANAQFALDDFEAYNLGQMGTQAAHWDTWSGNPNTGEDITVVDIEAQSGFQSGLVGPGGGSPEQDVILNLGNKTSSTWTVKFAMFIPTGKTGYYNLQGQLEPNGGAGSGAGVFNSPNLVFNNTQAANGAPGLGGAYPNVTDPDPTYSWAYPENAWFDIEIFYDVTNLTWQMKVDGVDVPAQPFDADATVGGIDFYAIDANNTFYIDDVLYVEGAIGATNDFAADNFKVYPNPVQDILNISSKVSVDTVTVYDVLGKVVLQAQPGVISPKVDMSALSSGAYLVQVTIGDASKTIKVIK